MKIKFFFLATHCNRAAPFSKSNRNCDSQPRIMSIPPSSPATSIASLPTPPGLRYHPDFTDTSGLNADVTLVSRDGVHFRINATALKSASGVFETILSLPQPMDTEWKEPVIASLDEHLKVLRDLLRIVSGQEIDPDCFVSLDSLQPRLLAAEKWDMRGALSIMRILLRTNPDLSSSNPMRVFWLGSHFGWKDVVSAASRFTCIDDLFLAGKKSLPVPVTDVTDFLRLMTFHKDRKDRMREHLLDGTIKSYSHTRKCYQDQPLSAEYQNFFWNVLQKMDHTSPASKFSDEDLLYMGAQNCLGTSPCPDCNSPARHSSEIFREIHRYWDTLQQTM